MIAGNYYDKYNSKNPIVRILMGRFFNVLLGFVKKLDIISCLEVGCGEGNVINKIKGIVNVKGSDIDEAVVDKARSLNPDVDFLVESVYDLQRKDDSFDLVIASEVLEHLDDPIMGLNEIKRVSKKYCLFSVPNEPLWRIANIMRLAYLKDYGNTPGHVQHWSYKGFRRMLKESFNHVVMKRAILWNFAFNAMYR